MQHRNHVQDRIIPFAVHYLLLAEKYENACKPFPRLSWRARAVSCAEACSELPSASLLGPAGGISSVKAAQRYFALAVF